MRIRQLSGLTDVPPDGIVLSVSVSAKPSPILLYSLGDVDDHRAKLLRILTGPSGVSLASFTMESVPWCSSASASAPLVVAGTQSAEILVFDADRGDVVNRFPMGTEDSAFRFKSVPEWSPREIFVGAVGVLGRCDLEAGKTMKVRVEKLGRAFPDHGRACFRGIVGDPSRGVLYAGSMDRSVSVVSLRTNRCEEAVASAGSVTSLGLTDDTNTLLVGTRDRGFGFLDVRKMAQPSRWINSRGETATDDPSRQPNLFLHSMRWVEVFDQLDDKTAVLGGTLGCWVFRLLDGKVIKQINQAEGLSGSGVKDVFGLLSLRRPGVVLDRVEEDERIRYLLRYREVYDSVAFVRISMVSHLADLAGPRWAVCLA